MLKNIILLLLLIVRNARSVEPEDCLTPNKQPGQCVLVKFCSIFHKHLQDISTKSLPVQFYDYLKRSHCGFIQNEVYICCAIRHITEYNAVTSTSTNPNPPSIRPPTVRSPTVRPPTVRPPTVRPPTVRTPTVRPPTVRPPTVRPPTVRPTVNLIKERTSAGYEFHKNINLLDINLCGIENSGRISHGNKTELNQYPWMALLQYRNKILNKLQFKCGGSLISTRYVLTAAHCVQSTIDILVSVRLGEHDIKKDIDCDDEIDDDDPCPPVQDIDVEEIIQHPEFKKTFKSDIALIRLKSAANIKQDNIKIICLPVFRNFDSIDINKAVVSGWGYTEKENNLNNELLQAEIPLQPNSVCQNYYKLQIDLENSELCGGGDDYIDTCYGDSGGPLFAPATIKQKIPLFYQIGIVSTGYTHCGGLNTTYTIYTRVTFFINWILDNLKP